MTEVEENNLGISRGFHQLYVAFRRVAQLVPKFKHYSIQPATFNYIQVPSTSVFMANTRIQNAAKANPGSESENPQSTIGEHGQQQVSAAMEEGTYLSTCRSMTTDAKVSI